MEERKMNIFNRLGAFLVFVSIFLLLPSLTFAEEEKIDPMATIEDVEPKVTSDGRELEAGGLLPMDAKVESDESGRALISLPDGTTIALDSKSELFLAEFSEEPEKESLIVKLAKGAARLTTGAIAKKNQLATVIETPQVCVGVRGTVLGIQTVEEETLVFLEETAGAGVEVKNIATGAQLVLKEVGNIVEVIRDRMTERPATRLEQEFFKNLAKGLKEAGTKAARTPLQELSNRYAGTWKGKISFVFKYPGRGRVLQQTATREVSFTIGDIIREVKLSTYEDDILVKASNDKGVEIAISNVIFPICSKGKIITKTIPKAVGIISPETGMGQFRVLDGKMAFDLLFQVESPDTMRCLVVESYIIDYKTKNKIYVLSTGKPKNPRETIFRRE